MNKIADSKNIVDNFKQIFYQHKAIMLLIDIDSFQILASNNSAESFYGYNSAEFEQLNISDLYDNSEDEKTAEMAESLGIELDHYEFKHKRKDESIVYVSVQTSKYEITGSNYLLSIINDISKNKLAKLALKESETNFRALFETIEDLIIIGTADGRILFTNKALPEKLGYGIDELKTMHVLDLHPVEKRKEAEHIFTEMFRGERDYCPLPLQIKNGNYLPVETRVWFGQWNGEDTIFGISKDLSKQQALADKFNKFFDSNPALMAVSSLTDRRFTDVNASFISCLGYTRSEIIGKTSHELDIFVEPEKMNRIAELLENSGKIRNIELKVKAKDGRILDGLFSGEIIDNQLEKSFLTVMIDITDRNKKDEENRILFDKVIESKELLETALYQKISLISELEEIKNKLENTVKEKDKFFSIIAHDLRSPFSGFLGLTELLSEQIYNLSLKDMQEFASSLNSSADNLYKLLENLLEWSRIQGGLIKYKPETVILNDSVFNNIELAKIKYKSKLINVSVNISEKISLTADDQMLNGILRNLISNAIKFTNKGGNIEIGVLEENKEQNPNFVTIYVKDSGIGMNLNLKNKLFIISEKTTRTGTDGETSTGLGLILCKEYVEMNGGKIWVESKVGSGSTFYFSMPKLQ